MSNKNEPAHPVQTGFGVVSKGMTKRELIAAMAMQGLLSNNCEEPNITGQDSICKHYADISVMYADALLEALK